MLNICLTFDYELFLGKNFGTEAEILFTPTEQILKLLKSENVSATFFIDICSAIQNEKLGRSSYVKAFREQIQELYREGQDVQLHIHPNWLRSVYKEKEWIFDQESYRLHFFGFDRKADESAFTIINNSIHYLNNILYEVDNNYRCIAYRAGGFAIQPHKELVKALYDCGICVDSSIAPHLVSTSNTNFYDYTHKTEQVNWYLSSEHEWWKNSVKAENSLYEIPIATENKNPISFLITRAIRPEKIKLHLGTKKGAYINEDSSKGSKNQRVSYWKYLSGYHALSLDAYRADFLYKQLSRYYKRNKCETGNFSAALIGHPKLVTDKYIENMKRLIQMIKSDTRFNLCNIYEVYKNKSLKRG